MTAIGHMIVGAAGWLLLFLIVAAAFIRFDEENTFNWLARCLCLLTVSVLLILYGCGAPHPWTPGKSAIEQSRRAA